jgi:hypothetical protein
MKISRKKHNRLLELLSKNRVVLMQIDLEYDVQAQLQRERVKEECQGE